MNTAFRLRSTAAEAVRRRAGVDAGCRNMMEAVASLYSDLDDSETDWENALSRVHRDLSRIVRLLKHKDPAYMAPDPDQTWQVTKLLERLASVMADKYAAMTRKKGMT